MGAGTGATVAKARGIAGAVKGGLGSASFRLPGGISVAAMVAVNAYGGLWDHRSGRLIAGPRKPNAAGFDDPVQLLLEGEPDEDGHPLSLALTIRPCHTMRDGDTMFAMATGRAQQPVQMTALGAAAVEVTAQAVLRAVQTATGLGGVPAVSEVPRG